MHFINQFKDFSIFQSNCECLVLTVPHPEITEENESIDTIKEAPQIEFMADKLERKSIGIMIIIITEILETDIKIGTNLDPRFMYLRNSKSKLKLIILLHSSKSTSDLIL